MRLLIHARANAKRRLVAPLARFVRPKRVNHHQPESHRP